MKTFNLQTQWGTTERVRLEKHQYSCGGSLAVEIISAEDGAPWSMLTVNLEDFPTSGNCAFVDTNNNGESIIDFIINNNLGRLTGRFGYSGWCVYPEVEFFVNNF